MSPFRSLTIVVIFGIGLAACAGSREVGQDEYTSTGSQPTTLTATPGILGDSGISLGGQKARAGDDASAGGITVNAYLWRGTLDTLSFMPLVSADPLGGVVITDWWESNTSPKERFKANVYILSRQLRADGVKLSLFRQVDQDGKWENRPVSDATVGSIQDRILARARELRVSVAGG